MHTYRAVVLGCGFRGRHHAINFLNNRDRFELVAICDRDEPRLRAVGDELAATPWRGTFERYADAEAMLREQRPEVFCFATPPSIRLPLIELGIRHGVKAIAYEKPMADSLAEAARIDALCSEAGVKTTNAHIHRYGEHWKAVKRLIDNGRLGPIESMHASSRGGYMGIVTHLVDYMIWFNGGARIEWVTGHVEPGHRPGRGRHLSPSYVLGRMQLDNGVPATVDCGDHAPHFGEPDLMKWFDTGVTVRGSDGWAQAVVGLGWRAALRGDPATNGSGEHVFRQCEDGDEYIADLARWLDDDGAVHPCNGDVTHHGFQAAMGVLLAALDRRKLTLPIEPPEPTIADRLGAEAAG